MEMFNILIAPFFACLVLIGIHCYLGLHIVSRGVIFVDLSLAQMAALGSTVGLLLRLDPASTESYFLSLGFAFLGALIFAFGRFKEEKIPQEAIIGMVYGVSSALAILLLQKAPHGAEELHSILVGSILFVSWNEIIKVIIIYFFIGLFHYIFRKKFMALTFGDGMSRASKRFWDFLFFVTFAIVITSSVKIAGILLVFSYLVIPAVAAMFFFKKISTRLIAGWIFGLIASIAGVWFSAIYDFPTGASIITALALMLIIVIAVQKIMKAKGMINF